MNVLPLVFSFLALITILTYTRLSGFVISKAVQQEYQQFIKNYQQDVLGKAAVQKYRKSAKGETDKKDPVSKTKTAAHRHLNLFPLFNKEDAKSQETAWIFKNLIQLLFAEEKFYKEAVANNPRMIEELIEAMQVAFKNVKEQKEFKKGDLCTLELNNPQLQFFLYKILKDPAGMEDEEDEEKMVSSIAARVLNGVISYNKTVRPIRIYLADRSLLLAIFGDERVVDNIVAARKNYYNLVQKSPDRKEALSQEFKSHFISALPPAVFRDSVNWDVSGTAPEKYLKSKET